MFSKPLIISSLVVFELPPVCRSPSWQAAGNAGWVPGRALRGAKPRSSTPEHLAAGSLAPSTLGNLLVPTELAIEYKSHSSLHHWLASLSQKSYSSAFCFSFPVPLA